MYISAIRKDDNVLVWERNDEGRCIKQFDAPYYFYTRDKKGKYVGVYGEKLTKHEFRSSRSFHKAKQDFESSRVRMYESDIAVELKILSEFYYNAPIPKLHVTFLDIEVDYDPQIGFSSVRNPYAPINSVALYHRWKEKYVVLAVPPEEWDGKLDPSLRELADITICKNEKDLLTRLLYEIEDSDVLCGWNSDFFDMPYIGKRVQQVLGDVHFERLSFEQAQPPTFREVVRFGNVHETIDLSGRLSVDYLALFQKYEMEGRPSYKLESIADEVLPHLPKLTYEGSLHNLYRSDFNFFIRYNIRDTEILEGFEQKLGYVELANNMYHLSTGLIKHVTGTLKLVDLAIINYCHYELGGVCVPDYSEGIDGQIEGALVLFPQIQMHDWLGSIDINSLYPSSIRSINISPETLRGQFNEKGKAWEAIHAKTELPLTLRLEDRSEYTATAQEWSEFLKQKRWAISGYGTVYDQSKKGIIPSILEGWYAKRKEYQALKKDAEKKGDKDKAAYYDRLQYVYKIKLNSTYGALTNYFFRFFDLRMGESVTGTGRAILKHQCRKVAEILDGKYLVEFPLYETPADVADTNQSVDITLHGPLFRGHFQSESIIYGDSVAGNTYITTPEGQQQISSLFKTIDYTKDTKEYSKCFQQALTFNPKTGHNEFRPIVYVMRHKINKKMYRVWYGNTRYIDVTEDHSLIGFANSRSKAPGLVEVKPTELGKNSINSLLLQAHIPTTTTHSLNLSKEMYQLIGYIIGDGYVEKNKESGVGLSLGRQDKTEVIQKLIQPLINEGWFTSYVEMRNGHDIRLCGVKGWYFLREHLYSSGEKNFPDWIFTETTENIAQVLKGYFSADGFANKNKTIGLCSTHKPFIHITNHLLKLCGIGSNYWTETTENSFRGKRSGTFTTRLTVYDAVKFGMRIGFIQSRKNQNIRTKYTRNTQHCLTQSGYVLVQPTKIEEIKYTDYVYDIEVDEIHTFYANDILVHNTDSVYFKTHASTKEEAIAVADAVAKKVNESFPVFMREAFLCTEGYDTLIKSAREVVSDRGIFVNKKRYALHVIDKEGKPSDSLKIMGLELKKTTLPKPIALKLTSFVERLLKREDWDIIARDIVDYKTELMQTKNIMDIGLPKGIKGIEEYAQKYKVYGVDTTLPGHVAAAIHFNECLAKYNDKEYLPISSGAKIKVFYLKGEYGKFKSIALPTDIENIPVWFQDEFAPNIARDEQVLRLVDKPLQHIFLAIDKQVPNNQSLLMDDLFSF